MVLDGQKCRRTDGQTDERTHARTDDTKSVYLRFVLSKTLSNLVILSTCIYEYMMGAQCLSGRVLDSRPRGRGFRASCIKPFMSNVFSHPYQLDDSISNFRVVVYSKFKRNLCSHTVENLIGRRVLRYLIWFCTVCRCHTKRTLDLYGLTLKEHSYAHVIITSPIMFAFQRCVKTCLTQI